MIAAVPLGLLISGRDWILGRTAAIEPAPYPSDYGAHRRSDGSRRPYDLLRGTPGEKMTRTLLVVLITAIAGTAVRGQDDRHSFAMSNGRFW